MSLEANRLNAYADLGDGWLRYQTARIRQKQLQIGRHCRLDVDGLLERVAREARAARWTGAQAACEHKTDDLLRRATVEAIEYCARLDAHVTSANVHQPSL